MSPSRQSGQHSGIRRNLHRTSAHQYGYFGPCVAYDTGIQEEVRLAQVVANGVASAHVVRGKDLSYFMSHRHRQWVREVMGEFEVVDKFADNFRVHIFDQQLTDEQTDLTHKLLNGYDEYADEETVVPIQYAHTWLRDGI
jgi:hypothetical protein